jgi:hypothetical protein
LFRSVNPTAATPVVVAVTVYIPSVEFAVTLPLAAPPPLTTAGLPLMTALAPEAGGLKVTGAPVTGTPLSPEVIVTASGPENVPPVTATWLLPAAIAI